MAYVPGIESQAPGFAGYYQEWQPSSAESGSEVLPSVYRSVDPSKVHNPKGKYLTLFPRHHPLLVSNSVFVSSTFFS